MGSLLTRRKQRGPRYCQYAFGIQHWPVFHHRTSSHGPSPAAPRIKSGAILPRKSNPGRKCRTNLLSQTEQGRRPTRGGISSDIRVEPGSLKLIDSFPGAGPSSTSLKGRWRELVDDRFCVPAGLVQCRLWISEQSRLPLSACRSCIVLLLRINFCSQPGRT